MALTNFKNLSSNSLFTGSRAAMPRMPQLPTSDTAQGMIQMLERQKAQHARAKMFKGQKPVSRPTRLERIQRQKGSVAYGAQMRVQIGSMVQHSIVSYVYPPSVAPLRQLAKMRIDELLLETNHRGRYLLLRTISQANKMTAVMAVVEDDSGRKDNVELLSLYNCLDDLQVKYLDDWIPKGTILIVKEPYYKLTADGNASIRVDHVSDVLFLEPVSNGEIAHCALRDCHEVGSGDLVKIGINLPVDWIPAKDQKSIQTPTELKDAGNFAYKRGNYYQAVKWYSRGIKAAVDSSEANTTISTTIRLNRVQAYLSLGFYEKALAEANFILKSMPNNEKALFRAARALYLLGQYEESRALLKESLLPTHTDNNEAKSLLLDTEARLKEKATGSYDFSKWYSLVKGKGAPAVSHGDIDIANYQSPAIAIQEIDQMGRGVVAMQEVQPGDLLIVEKAWAIGYTSEENGMRMLINLETKEGRLGAHAALAEKCVFKAWKTPQRARAQMLELWNGSYQRVENGKDLVLVDGIPVVDAFLNDRIRSLNAFGCSLLTTDEVMPGARKLKGSADEDQDSGNCGLWIGPSYINHACVANCYRTFLGDIMIIRASKQIKKGEQLVFQYFNPMQPADGVFTLEERHKKGKSWGFKCACQLCTSETADKQAVRARRQALYRKIEERLKNITDTWPASPSEVEINGFQQRINGSLPSIMKLIKDLHNTYPASRPPTLFPRLHVALAQVRLMNLTSVCGGLLDEHRKSIREILAALGWVIIYPEDAKSGKLEVQSWGVLVPFVLTAWANMWSYVSILLMERVHRGMERGDLENYLEEYRNMTRRVFVIVSGSDAGWTEFEKQVVMS